jgi:hypothetical protein
MRSIAVGWICLVACGPAPPPTEPAAHPARRSVTPDPDRPVIDPIAALAPDDDAEVSWVIPGPIELELGGPSLGAGGSGPPIEVGAIDRQGNLERIAVRLEHARFSVWIDRAHLLSVLTREQRIEVAGLPVPGSDAEVVLRAGARVRRLAQRDRSTRVLYLDVLQVDGWVPDAALADRGPPRAGNSRVPTGLRSSMVFPGAVIRAAPRWAAAELAIVATGVLFDTVRDIDDAWTEVSFMDVDVMVHGFVSRRDPPGRVRHWHGNDAATAITPNTTVASGTCLYARPGGEAIGYVVGNRAVDLDDAGAGSWTLTLDTPWGPVGFAAAGATRTELVACAPPGSVPPVTPPVP